MAARTMRRNRPILLLEERRLDAPTAGQALDALGMGGRVICSAAAPETVTYLRTQTAAKPCVVLLEVDGLTGDGMATLRTIKADEQLRSIPVIVLGPSGDVETVNESFGLGAAGYMAKSPDYRELAGAFRTICDYWTLSELPA